MAEANLIDNDVDSNDEDDDDGRSNSDDDEDGFEKGTPHQNWLSKNFCPQRQNTVYSIFLSTQYYQFNAGEAKFFFKFDPPFCILQSFFSFRGSFAKKKINSPAAG